jgi:hypothetical protein
MGEGSGTERDKMTNVLSVRFAPDEMDSLRQTADRAGVSVSSYVRDSVLTRSVQSLPLSPRNAASGGSVTLTLGSGALPDVPLTTTRLGTITIWPPQT